MDTSQYLSMFLEESIENLQTLNESILDLEQNPEDIDKLNEIFRVAHTIKGMAATMGFSDMAELTHKMEDVLSKFRNGELKVTQGVVTILFDCLDTLERMVDNIQEENDESVDFSHIMEALEQAKNGGKNQESKVEKVDLNEYDISVMKKAKEKGHITLQIDIQLSENTLLKSARAFLIVKELETYGEIIKSEPKTEDIESENFDYTLKFILLSHSSAETVKEAIEGVSEVRGVECKRIDADETEITEKAIENSNTKQVVSNEVIEANENEHDDNLDNKSSKSVDKQKKNKEHKKVHQSVRVDLERLDKLMNMLSELVIHRTRLEQISNSCKSPELNETLEQVARTTSDLQDLVMKIRMLPLDVVFNRFPRMIRDLSVELDKEINFVIEGADTELDRTVIDEIGEPLIHLLRNAADHGIESKEDRTRAGKHPVGNIKLSAYQEGTKAVIKVEDDGAGISAERIKAKAERVGLPTEGMSDHDIKNLIFAQGFSTNEVVTDISGRGVGMDVVKTKISSLGGTVDLYSEEGKGTTFIIKLPLTLQIIQALLVKVGEETLTISLGVIDKVIDYREDRIKRSNGKEVILYREQIIPLIRLNERLDIECSNSNKKFIIIVKIGEKTVGLLVDSLLGQQEIVIKKLGKTLEGLKEYIGATILGDGLVTLILDIAALL